MIKGLTEERFWSRVEKGPDCWVWTGPRGQRGYGQINVGGRTLRVHRVSWAMHHGDPGELFVCHKCDNPPCVRPDHLFIGTHTDNMRDKISKGRGRGTDHMKYRTHCPKGHGYTPENTYTQTRPWGGIARFCRECHKVRSRAYRAANALKRAALARVGGMKE